MQVDQADRLFRRPAARAGDARHRHGHVRLQALAHPLCHRARHLCRHGTVFPQELVRHAELLDLHGVRVGDDAADEDVARPGHRGQPRGDHAAGARLGRDQREPTPATGVEHERLDRHVRPVEQVVVQRCN